MFRAEQLIGALEYQYKFGAIEFCCLRAWPGTLLNLFYCPRYDDVDVVAIVSMIDALILQLCFMLSHFLALMVFCCD